MFNVKEAPWKVILLYVLVSIGLVMLINLVLFPSTVFDPISKATAGLVDATLQAGLLSMLVFSLIVFGWAKLRPSDVGLDWSRLGQGLLLTALLWLATQAIVLLINALNGDIHLDPLWKERGVTTVIGWLIAQLLGNAFYEEVLYRGFYLSQFYLKIHEANERRRLAWAILAMLGLFILSHIPNRIFHGYSLADIPLDFALLFAWGLFFTAIYLISGNLFLAIGVHALINRPAMITEATFPVQALIFILTWILLAVVRRQQRKAVPSLSTV
jgi:hypothetical protein